MNSIGAEYYDRLAAAELANEHSDFDKRRIFAVNRPTKRRRAVTASPNFYSGRSREVPPRVSFRAKGSVITPSLGMTTEPKVPKFKRCKISRQQLMVLMQNFGTVQLF